MARVLSLPVLGGGALVASPALWAAFVDGTMAAETALGRFGVGAAFVWVGLSLLGSLVEGTSSPPGPEERLPTGPASPVRASVVDPEG